MTHSLVLLIAYIRPSRRAAVVHALREAGAPGWSESEIVGHGHAADGQGVRHLRVELLATPEVAAVCGKAIVEAARTGQDGDGLVLTLPALSAERVRDGTLGGLALKTP